MQTKKTGFLPRYDGSSDSVASESESDTEDTTGGVGKKRRFRRRSGLARRGSEKIGTEAKFYLFNDCVLIV